MATISTHVLDSVIGTHAAGIRVECFRRLPTGQSISVFDVTATQEGRISEAVEADAGAEFELVFHSAAYYKKMQLPDDGYQVVNSIVIRITTPEADEKYHLPIMLSPHSYSVWWSGKPPAVNQ
jgi:5-hydroxyisourate hydrolase